MTLPREPFSWDGEDEQPVPLNPQDFDPGITEASAIVGEIKIAVGDARDASARQATDPAISHPVEAAKPPVNAFGGQGGVGGRALRGSALVISLVLGCLLAFAHGWTTGASARNDSPSGFCDAAHCPSNMEGNE